MATGDPRSKTRIDLIQVMRAAAAMLVVIGHSQTTVAQIAGRAGLPFVRCRVLPWGAGVDLFFVISGFIMVHASQRLFAAPGGRMEFVRRRVSRVVPLYWACTALYLFIVMWAHLKGAPLVFSPQAVAASLLFIPFPSYGAGGGFFPVLTLGWTLNFEMFFYALFAVAVAWPRRRAVPVVICLLVALTVMGAVLRPPAPLGSWTQPIVLDFALGMLVAQLRCEGVRWSKGARLAIAAVGVAAFALDPLKLFSGPEGSTTANGLARVLTSGLPAALVLAAAVFGPNLIWSPLRPAVAVGDASYSLYLSHSFVLIVLEKLAAKTSLAAWLGPWPLVLIAVVAAPLTSLLVFRWVEEPLTRRASRLAHGLDRPATAPVAVTSVLGAGKPLAADVEPAS